VHLRIDELVWAFGRSRQASDEVKLVSAIFLKSSDAPCRLRMASSTALARTGIFCSRKVIEQEYSLLGTALHAVSGEVKDRHIVAVWWTVVRQSCAALSESRAIWREGTPSAATQLRRSSTGEGESRRLTVLTGNRVGRVSISSHKY